MSLWSNYSTFFQMCDSIEGVRPVENGTRRIPVSSYSNKTGVPVPADGIGLSGTSEFCLLVQIRIPAV